jgi:ABC-2 type transport system permease protein
LCYRADAKGRTIAKHRKSRNLFRRATPPIQLRALASIDPLSYGVDGMRGLLLGASRFDLAMDVMVLLGIATIFLGAGSYRFAKVEA